MREILHDDNLRALERLDDGSVASPRLMRVIAQRAVQLAHLGERRAREQYCAGADRRDDGQVDERHGRRH